MTTSTGLDVRRNVINRGLRVHGWPAPRCSIACLAAIGWNPRVPGMSVTVAALQMSMSDHIDQNIATAERLVRSAAASGAQIILIPELFEGHYFCVDQLPEHFGRARPVEGHPTVEHFRRVAAELNVVLPVSI